MHMYPNKYISCRQPRDVAEGLSACTSVCICASARLMPIYVRPLVCANPVSPSLPFVFSQNLRSRREDVNFRALVSQLYILRMFLFFGSRPSDHYFRSVCLSVCLFVCAEFFSAVFGPISIKLGHMLYVLV